MARILKKKSFKKMRKRNGTKNTFKKLMGSGAHSQNLFKSVAGIFPSLCRMKLKSDFYFNMNPKAATANPERVDAKLYANNLKVLGHRNDTASYLTAIYDDIGSGGGNQIGLSAIAQVYKNYKVVATQYKLRFVNRCSNPVDVLIAPFGIQNPTISPGANNIVEHHNVRKTLALPMATGAENTVNVIKYLAAPAKSGIQLASFKAGFDPVSALDYNGVLQGSAPYAVTDPTTFYGLQITCYDRTGTPMTSGIEVHGEATHYVELYNYNDGN